MNQDKRKYRIVHAVHQSMDRLDCYKIEVLSDQTWTNVDSEGNASTNDISSPIYRPVYFSSVHQAESFIKWLGSDKVAKVIE